jgi:hypothetical protein
LAATSPPPILPLIQRQRLTVALDRAAHRLQFAAARKQAAQRLKRDGAAPAPGEPGAKRLFGLMSGRADRKRKCGRQRHLVQPDFAFDVLFVAKGERQPAAQPRTGNRAVEIAEGKLVACQRDARRQSDVLRQHVRWLEVEQRPEIGTPYPQIEARSGILCPWLGRTFGVGIEPRSRDLRLQPQRRTPGAGDRAFELRRAIAGRDHAIEAEQGEQ